LTAACAVGSDDLAIRQREVFELESYITGHIKEPDGISTADRYGVSICIQDGIGSDQ
jgi:hypothetical protein